MDPKAFTHDTFLRYRAEIIQVMQDLVRIPSQNSPPTGEEGACQAYIAGYLRRHGLTADVYEPDQAAGLVDHPAYWPGRDYHGRPNVSSILDGRGGGRSLLLTGHCDTVPVGEGLWTIPPFGGEIRGERLYGLGSLDMKGPLAAMLVLFKAVAEQGIPLRGALCFESAVDEEFGGVNGTLAGRFRHGPMDGAVIGEGTNLEVYPAAKGLLLSHLLFRSNRGSFVVAASAARGAERADVMEQIGLVLGRLDALRASRRQRPTPPLYRSYPDPIPVEVMKVYAGGWGTQVPVTVPAEGRLELIVYTLPGERREDVLAEQEAWLADVVAQNQAAFATTPDTQFPIRWMPATTMNPEHPIVSAMAASVARVTGKTPAVVGAPYTCDLFALQQVFGMPALVFGPSGGNAHAGDEYLDLDTLFVFWECLLAFVLEWCGVA